MNLRDLQQQILNKHYEDIYVFVGNEIEIEKVYINKLSEISNLSIQYVDYYKDIISKLNVKNLFSNKYIYVILYDEEIFKHEDVFENINTNNNIVIFKYLTLDKRSKFYKQFEQKVVEFNKLDENVLCNYVKKLTNLNNFNCKQLVSICDNSYDRILLEVNKLKNYDWDNAYNITDDIAFNELVSQNAFCADEVDQVFEFIDAFICRDLHKLKQLYNSIKQTNDNVLGILTLLYNNIKSILLVQSCTTNDVSKTTGLTSQQVYFAKQKIGGYKIHELVTALNTIFKLDKTIKSGVIDEDIAIDYLLVNIFY